MCAIDLIIAVGLHFLVAFPSTFPFLNCWREMMFCLYWGFESVSYQYSCTGWYLSRGFLWICPLLLFAAALCGCVMCMVYCFFATAVLWCRPLFGHVYRCVSVDTNNVQSSNTATGVWPVEVRTFIEGGNLRTTAFPKSAVPTAPANWTADCEQKPTPAR